MNYLTEKTKRLIIDAPLGSVILLFAQTGAGKTWHILHELLTHVRFLGKKLLLVVNRSGLKGQLFKEACKIFNIDTKNVDICDDLHIAIGPIYIVNYQYLAKRLITEQSPYMKIGPYRADEYGVVVFDEAHYFIADASISVASDSLKYLTRVFTNQKRIYISATMKPVRNLIFKLEHVVDTWDLLGSSHEIYSPYEARYIRIPETPVNKIKSGYYPAEVLEVGNDINYDYLHPRILDDDADIFQDICIQKKCGKLKKAIVFVSSKEAGQKMLNEYNKKYGSTGSKAGFICSKYDEHYMKKEELALFQEIQDTDRFSSVDVLFTTTAMDNGISIKDPELTHIYIEGTEYISAVQQAGRGRVMSENHVIELVFPRHDLAYFKKQLNTLENMQRFLNKFKMANDDYRVELAASEAYGLIRNRYVDYDDKHRPIFNEFADYALAYRIEDTKETVKLLSSDPDGYVKKFLGFFGKSYNSAEDEQKKKVLFAQNCITEFLEKESECKSYRDQSSCDEFRQKLKKLFEDTGITICNGRSDRIPAVSKVNELIAPYGYSFDGPKSKWRICRKENSNVSENE